MEWNEYELTNIKLDAKNLCQDLKKKYQVYINCEIICKKGWILNINLSRFKSKYLSMQQSFTGNSSMFVFVDLINSKFLQRKKISFLSLMLKADKHELWEKSLWNMGWGWLLNPSKSSEYFYEINKSEHLMLVH